MPSWILHAEHIDKAAVEAELAAARDATVAGALEDDGNGLDPGTVEQMDVGIAAAAASAQLVAGDDPVDVDVAGSGHEDNVRLILTVSRGSEPAFVDLPDGGDG